MVSMKFIKEHRKEIDACLNKHCPKIFGRLNDDVRWLWITKVLPEKKCHEGINCNHVCKIKEF